VKADALLAKTAFSLEEQDGKAAAVPRVLLAYQDAEIGCQAMSVWERMEQEVGDNGSLNEGDFNQLISVWSFDYFQSSEFRSAAAEQARQAAAIVLAIRRTVEPPAAVKAWNKSWSDAPNHPGALIVVFDQSAGPDAEDGSACSELYAIGRKTNRRFFCYAVRRSKRGAQAAFNHGSTETLPPVWNSNLPDYRIPHYGWGLNE
jgi:hypothetical protein